MPRYDALVAVLADAIATRVIDSIARGEGRVQPVFVGPPAEVLEELLPALRSAFAATRPGTPVELVADPHEVTAGSVVAAWGHVVSLRGSTEASVVLASPHAFETRGESLTLAADTFGSVGPVVDAIAARAFPWPEITSNIATRTGASEDFVAALLRVAGQDLANLDASEQDGGIWRLASNMLSVATPSDAAALAGVPATAVFSEAEVKGSRRVLGQLKDACARLGIRSAFERLEEARVELELINPAFAAHKVPLASLEEHLWAKSASTAAFVESPSTRYAVDMPVPAWWAVLSSADLQSLLEQAGLVQRQQAGASLRVDNVMFQPTGAEPCLVPAGVDLMLVDRTGTPLATATFSRRTGRSAYAAVPTTGAGTGQETMPPAHDAPLTYRGSHPLYAAATVAVISLETFGLRAFGRFPQAVSYTNPSRDPVTGLWAQQVVISQSGRQELEIYGPPGSSASLVDSAGAAVAAQPCPAVFAVDMDHGDKVQCEVSASGATVAQWTISAIFEEEPSIDVPTYLEALIAAHHREGGGRPPRPVGADSELNGLMTRSLVPGTSGVGLAACWSGPHAVEGWTGSPTVGDIDPPDRRPPLDTVPARLVEIRDSIVAEVNRLGGGIEVIDLSREPFPTLASAYLEEYLSWLAADTAHAPWWEVVAIHAPIPARPGRPVAASEPTALLLPPLHPLRLAWQVNAQRVLTEGLSATRCRVAGVIDPHATPAAMAVPLFNQDDKPVWRTYLAGQCDQAYWSVLWNGKASTEQRLALSDILERLGVSAGHAVLGLTADQVRQVLDDLVTLLPARATYRVSLDRAGDRTRAGVQALIDWCQATFTPTSQWPRGMIVTDSHSGDPYPSAAVISGLTDATEGRVEWFDGVPRPPEYDSDDLSILDELVAVEEWATSGDVPSALGPGALFRRNVRQDVGPTPIQIVESRVAGASLAGPGLGGQIVAATVALETLAASDPGTSHWRFNPNIAVLEERLRQAIFVAATSSQLDPSCFMRGSSAAGGYLWDYRLPPVVKGAGQSAGYYLIARHTDQLREAMADAVRLTGSTLADIDSLMREASERGITALKGFALGGSRARGQLGLLVAMQILQRRGGSAAMPLVDGLNVNLLVALDPYDGVLREVRASFGQPGTRADLLVLQLCVGDPLRIRVVPVEVKFRGSAVMPEGERKTALAQANSSAMLLARLWTESPPSELWDVAGRALLSEIVDHAFRINSVDPAASIAGNWQKIHSDVLAAIGEGRADVEIVEAGRLIVIDGTGASRVVDDTAPGSTLVVSLEDAAAVLEGRPPSAVVDDAVMSLGLAAPCIEPKDAGAIGRTVEPEPSGAGEVGAQVAIPAPLGSAADNMQPTEVPEHRDAFPGAGVEPEAPAPAGPGVAAYAPGVIGVPIGTATHGELRTAAVSSARARVAGGLEGFVGNAPATSRLTRDLLAALASDPPRLGKSYLLTGPASVGKTELARRIARILGFPFAKLDGRALTTRERLAELLDEALSASGREPPTGDLTFAAVYPPMVVLVDEAHLVPRVTQQALLTALDREEGTALLARRRIDVSALTFILATTNPSELDTPLRTRCTEIQLNPYSRAEVADILRLKLGRDWSRDAYMKIAELGRDVPRIAIDIALEVETSIAVAEETQDVIEHIETVRRDRELDEKGLSRLDFNYLRTLAEQQRPVGEAQLLNLMTGADRSRVVEEVEPFLIRLGFVSLADRGRMITGSGRRYLQDWQVRGFR